MSKVRFADREIDLSSFGSKADLERVFSRNINLTRESIIDILWAIRNVQPSTVSPVILVEVDTTDQDGLDGIVNSINELIERNPAKYGYLSEAIVTNLPVKISMIPGELLSARVTPDEQNLEVTVGQKNVGRLKAILKQRMPTINKSDIDQLKNT